MEDPRIFGGPPLGIPGITLPSHDFRSDFRPHSARVTPPQQPSDPRARPVFDGAKSIIKVHRVSPSKPRWVCGHYRNYEIEQLPNVENLIREEYGAGDFRIEVWDESGKLLSSKVVPISGGPPKDAKGNEIKAPESGDPELTVAERAGGIGYQNPHQPFGEYQMGQSLEKALADIRSLQARIDRIQAKNVELQDQLREKDVQLAELKSTLARKDEEIRTAEKMAKLEAALERAQEIGKGKGSSEQSIMMEFLKMQREDMRAARKRDDGGDLAKLIEAFDLFERLKGSSEPDDGLGGILAGAGTFLEKYMAGRAALEAARPAPAMHPHPTPPPPAQSHTPHVEAHAHGEHVMQKKIYTSDQFKVLLGKGLGAVRPNMTNDEIVAHASAWADEAIAHLTPEGREALMAIADAATLQQFASGIPGLSMPKLIMSLGSVASRQTWLEAAIGALQARVSGLVPVKENEEVVQ